MLNFDDYKKTPSRPDKDDYTITYAYKKGEVQMRKKSSINRAEMLRGGWLLEDETDEVAYNKAMDEYNSIISKLFYKFKFDLLGDLDILGNPKADKLFNIAWERGGSYGYQEVYVQAEELVELIK